MKEGERASEMRYYYIRNELMTRGIYEDADGWRVSFMPFYLLKWRMGITKDPFSYANPHPCLTDQKAFVQPNSKC